MRGPGLGGVVFAHFVRFDGGGFMAPSLGRYFVVQAAHESTNHCGDLGVWLFTVGVFGLGRGFERDRWRLDG